MKILEKKWIIITLASFLFIGCSGDSDNGTTNTIAFPSSAINSEPTIENGTKVKEIVSQNQQEQYAINSVSDSNTQNIAITMKKLNDITSSKINYETYSLNETVNETENCINGGNINTTGSGSETTGGSITITFNSCNEDDLVMNGKMHVTLSKYDATYEDYANISLTILEDVIMTSSQDGTIKLKSGSTITTESSNFTSYYEANKMKMTISAISEIGPIKTGQEDAVYYFDLSYYEPSMYQTQGKIYINNLESYVEYDTSYDMSQTPFVFSYYGLESGEARYNTAKGGKVKVTAENGVAKAHVDVNGDGIYELSESL